MSPRTIATRSTTTPDTTAELAKLREAAAVRKVLEAGAAVIDR
jgi:hypothetical protein